jgi:hypothetical protein
VAADFQGSRLSGSDPIFVRTTEGTIASLGFTSFTPVAVMEEIARANKQTTIDNFFI